jgi:carbon storage regulator
MLVLSRKIGQEIIIGDGIHVTVVSIRGESVRLGVSAPPSVTVDRQEVHERRMAAQESIPLEEARSE